MQVSWDQHASHQVLYSWAERAMNDEHVSGIGAMTLAQFGDTGGGKRDNKQGGGIHGCVESEMHSDATSSSVARMREAFVRERLNEVDMQFGRTLGCRVSPELSRFIDSDNHLKKGAKNKKT